MSGEIDIYDNTTIAPYEPNPPVQINVEPGFELTNREIDEYTRAPSAPTMFGTPIPGATPQQIQQALREMGALFSRDMAVLKYPPALVNSAVSFMQNNATKPLKPVQKNHFFNLHSEAGDPLAEAFGNHLAGIPGFTNQQKQSFLSAALKWLVLVNKQLTSKQQAVSHAPRMAPNSSQAVLSQLSDAEYARVVKINEQAQLNTLNTLAAKHGQYTAQNMIALANAQLQKLTPAEAAHFDQFTTGFVHMMNSVEAVEYLYGAAIGTNSIPKDGAGIASELKMFEAMLKNPSERAKYLKDPELQARYRTLLDIRDGG